VDDMALVLRRGRLRWFGHVLRGDDGDKLKGCVGSGGPGERLSRRIVGHVE